MNLFYKLLGLNVFFAHAIFLIIELVPSQEADLRRYFTLIFAAFLSSAIMAALFNKRNKELEAAMRVDGMSEKFIERMLSKSSTSKT